VKITSVKVPSFTFLANARKGILLYLDLRSSADSFDLESCGVNAHKMVAEKLDWMQEYQVKGARDAQRPEERPSIAILPMILAGAYN
jgi:hypothetical protein